MPVLQGVADSDHRMIERDYVQTGKNCAAVNVAGYSEFILHRTPPYCAAAQGKFWNLHDRIFDTQNSWKGLMDARPYLDSLALASGVDGAKLKACEQQAPSSTHCC